MTDAHEAIQETLLELEKLRKLIAKGTSRQVYGASELDLIKANVYTWLRSRRTALTIVIGGAALKEVDS